MSTTIATFRNYVKPEISQCPNVVLDRYVLEALIEFCTQSRILRVNADDVSVLADTSEYSLTFNSLPYSPVSLRRAYLGDGSSDDTRIQITTERELNRSGQNWEVQTVTGDITHVFLKQTGKVRVYPVPTANMTDSLRLLDVAVCPTRSATEVDDILYNDHIEAIRDGALSKLLLLKNRPWTDIDAAKRHRWDFQSAIGQAKGLANQGKSDGGMVASYSGSSMF
jgi:hypothetical protein